MRTTVDIDEPILADLKRLQRREGKSLGRLVSDLLAQALADDRGASKAASRKFNWVTRPMGSRFDLADTQVLYDAMDRPKR
jgi:hypothetical protein